MNTSLSSKPLALIVDDARVIRVILSDLMQSLAFEVLTASQGDDALRLLASSPPVQVAFIDWEMPSMDGISLVRAIRRQARFAAMRIIMLTAKNSHEDLCMGISCGADEYMMKPFSPAILLDKLRIVGLWHDAAPASLQGDEQEPLIGDTTPLPSDPHL